MSALRAASARTISNWCRALGRDKSNISHSLRTLEARGLITIGRSAGGQATYLDLTPEGRKLASKLAQKL